MTQEIEAASNKPIIYTNCAGQQHICHARILENMELMLHDVQFIQLTFLWRNLVCVCWSPYSPSIIETVKILSDLLIYDFNSITFIEIIWNTNEPINKRTISCADVINGRTNEAKTQIKFDERFVRNASASASSIMVELQ